METAKGTTRVVVICEAPLPRAAWVQLIDAQPRLQVVAAVATFQNLDLKATVEQLCLFWASAELHKDSPLSETVYWANRFGTLCLFDSYELPIIIRFLQAGFCSFITPAAEVSEMASALIATRRKEIVLPSTIASQALAALARGDQNKPEPDELTYREKEVLALLAQGLTNKAIAQMLFLSVRTVEAHLRSIYGKLAVASRTEAAIWAVQHDYGR